ncbi:MAG: hypothetical protein ACRDRE_21950, partial [Pseudonocardiaceae bacterium]
GQQVVHLFQRDRRQVPHLRPAHARIRALRQIRAAPRVVTRCGQRLGPIRSRGRRQPRPLTTRLPTRLAIGRALRDERSARRLALAAIESADGGIEE